MEPKMAVVTTEEQRVLMERIHRQVQEQLMREKERAMAEYSKAPNFSAQAPHTYAHTVDSASAHTHTVAAAAHTHTVAAAPISVHRRPMEWNCIAGVSNAHVAKWVEAYVECKPAEYVRGVVSWENGGGGLMRYIDHPDHLRGLAPGRLCIVMGRGIPKQLVEIEEQAERNGWRVDVVNRPSRHGARTVFPDEAYGLNFTEAVLGEFKTAYQEDMDRLTQANQAKEFFEKYGQYVADKGTIDSGKIASPALVTWISKPVRL